MYEIDFEYPTTLAEAVQTLKRTGGRPISGGQTLVAAMKTRLSQPGTLVNLGGIAELRGIRATGSSLVIGAMTRHVEVETSPEVQKAIPALARLAGGIGDRQVRNMGTLGGAIANSDPAADYPAAVMGLGATIVTNKGKHEADKFFKGLFETALAQGEIITSVSFPVPKRAAYMKFKNPASRFAIVGVFVADFGGGNVRVGVTGAAGCAFRQTDMEKALAAKFDPASVAGIKVSDKGLNSDLHASAEYRAHLVTVMAKRAVEAALK